MSGFAPGARSSPSAKVRPRRAPTPIAEIVRRYQLSLQLVHTAPPRASASADRPTGSHQAGETGRVPAQIQIFQVGERVSYVAELRLSNEAFQAHHALRIGYW